jgi:flagella basal body P-ring formation protein FlgA
MAGLLRTFLLTVIVCAYADAGYDGSVRVTFKDSASVNDTVIRLRDIGIVQCQDPAVDVKTIEDLIVGEAAPAGYYRLVNSDEAICYAIRPHFKTVKPSPGQKKSVKVATVSSEKKVGDYEAMIQSYLHEEIQWHKDDYTVVIRNNNQKIKVLDKPLTATVTGLATHYPKGSVNLKIIFKQGTRTHVLPVVCAVRVVAPVVVSRLAIKRNTPLSDSNCVIEKRDITGFKYTPVTSLSGVRGMIAARSIPQEAIVHEKILAHAPLIEKDEQVFVAIDRGAIKISVVMRARECGGMGDKIWVENEQTHKLIKTRIVGKGKVTMIEGEKMI